jgi:hypothetical protein
MSAVRLSAAINSARSSGKGHGIHLAQSCVRPGCLAEVLDQHQVMAFPQHALIDDDVPIR